MGGGRYDFPFPFAKAQGQVYRFLTGRRDACAPRWRRFDYFGTAVPKRESVVPATEGKKASALPCRSNLNPPPLKTPTTY